MNEQWVNWILLSIFDHFKNKVGVSDYPFFVPSQELPPDIGANRFELVFLGPDFQAQPNEEYRTEIILNLAVITNKVPDSLTAHYAMIGKGMKFFTKCIPIYQYGTGQNQAILPYPLELDSPIRTTDIMLFDPVSRQQRSTIEARYSGQLQGT